MLLGHGIVGGDFEGLARKIDWHVLSARVDLLQQVLKGKVHFSVRHCRCLHELHVLMLLAQLLSFLLSYLTLAWVLLDQVQFIADEHDLDVVLG